MLFKRTHKQPIPEGAKITRLRSGQRLAKWTDSRGRKQEAKVSKDGGNVLIEAKEWTARYRDASGRLVQRPTECERLENAQAKLSYWQGLEEKRRAGIITASEAGASEWAHVDISEHVSAFKEYMTGKGLNANHVKVTASYLKRILAAVKVKRISDLNRERLERLGFVYEGIGRGSAARGPKERA